MLKFIADVTTLKSVMPLLWLCINALSGQPEEKIQQSTNYPTGLD